ncbi:hypothetical protein Nepgr_030443 [Nepenthes gracilis]|uniref:Uncharacterized protein n=1 Tax=Nepenthes gracilis TaxID=150966 RepID=A0AAD3TFC1_NEPGR|nr:hypothetical protein Nepgr_030443 [Nepenthes gracilis]
MMGAMAHAFAQAVPAATSTPMISSLSRSSSPSLHFHISSPCRKGSAHSSSRSTSCLQRRSIALGLAAAVLGMTVNRDEQSAWAAARRPPPAPPAEKKDPSVSGLQAKILASKKRKETMKEAIAKQREMGKRINQ